MRKQKHLDPVDRLWLAEYDEQSERRRKTRERSVGASQSGRKVKFEMEEHAEAVGTGTAASAAASAALMAREEGRRLDSLTVESVDALKEACGVYRDICLSLKERMEVLENTHIAMLDSVRSHYLSRVETEAELTALEGAKSDDVATNLVIQLLGKRFGAKGIPSGKRKPVDKTS